MAQMEFYFNDTERLELFNFIYLKGGEFIPDTFFKTDKPELITNYNEFLSCQQNDSTHFFLIDKVYSLEPLLISKNRFIKEDKYSINQRKGGPYIDFSFYRGYANDSIIKYKSSIVSIYPKFIHYNNHEEFKAPEILKKYYGDIVKYIKSKCKVVKIDKKNYWISEDVLKEIESNKR